MVKVEAFCFQSQAPVSVKTSVLLVDGKFTLVTLDYHLIKEKVDNGETSDMEPAPKKMKEEAPATQE